MVADIVGDQPSHLAGGRRIGGFRIEPALILALALVVGHVATSAGRLELIPACEPCLVVGSQIRLEHIDTRVKQVRWGFTPNPTRGNSAKRRTLGTEYFKYG